MRAFDEPSGAYRGNYDVAGIARIWYVERPGGEALEVPRIVRHSPNGFAWGYTGNGAADAALSILTHAASPEIADAHYQAFKRDVVATLRINEPFRLDDGFVTNWLTERGVSQEPVHTSNSARVLPPAGDGALPALVEAPQRASDFDRIQPELAGNLQHRRVTRMMDQARELAERERRLDQREMRLDDRAAALKAMDVAEPVWDAPAEPIRAEIRWFLETTGDRLSTVAHGLGVEAAWAQGVLDGTITTVDLDHIQRLCETLRCNPYDLWGAEIGRSLLHAYGPELWPADMMVLPGGHRDHGPTAPHEGPDLKPPEPPSLGL